MPWPPNPAILLRFTGHLLLGLLLAAIVFRRNDRRSLEQRHRLQRWWHRRLCVILGIRIRAAGIPANAPCLLVCNHLSWLDIPVLFSVYPGAFVAKQEVGRWPVVGWLARRAGTIFIQRGRTGAVGDAITQMAWKLHRGESVVLFPEGTTSDGSGVRRFHAQLLEAGLLAGVAIQPTALRYVDEGYSPSRVPFIGEDAFVPHLLRLMRKRGSIRAEVRFFEPLPPHLGNRSELAALARSQILASLQGATARLAEAG